MAGRKTKLQSNLALAKEHAKGATVSVIQVLNHGQYGAIAYIWPRMWVFERQLAEDARFRLGVLHLRVLEVGVDTANMRTIADLDLLRDVYAAGTEMVSHSVRSIQHLSEEMERVAKSQLEGSTAEDRLKEAAALFDIDPMCDQAPYQGFAEMQGVRDAVEHPREWNIYQGDQNRWDEVPLAWSLSDRSLQAFGRFRVWFDRLADEWLAYMEAHPQPATLVVERGIESTLQVKKPRKPSH